MLRKYQLKGPQVVGAQIVRVFKPKIMGAMKRLLKSSVIIRPFH